jgi:protein arginine kinase
MSLISIYRFGVDLEMIKGVKRRQLNQLMVLAQPAHIQKLAGKDLEPQERDQFRAELVRKKMNL